MKPYKKYLVDLVANLPIKLPRLYLTKSRGVPAPELSRAIAEFDINSLGRQWQSTRQQPADRCR